MFPNLPWLVWFVGFLNWRQPEDNELTLPTLFALEQKSAKQS